VASAFPLLAAVALAQNPGSPAPRYRAVRIDGFSTVVALQKEYGPDGFDTILRINRVDLPHVRQGATLIVPDRSASAEAVTPFPQRLPDLDAVPARMFLVSRRIQAFAAYESGVLVRWGPTSTGREETPTPAGLFATNWKSKLRRSSDNREWLLPWYVNFINASGVSFHQFALPGYPASHACARLLDADAKWIYDWAESWVLSEDQQRVLRHGTPVLVFGDYDYTQPGPWTRLAEDPDASTVTLDEMTRAIEPHRAKLIEWLALRKMPS
jgi:hypothetical protein